MSDPSDERVRPEGLCNRLVFVTIFISPLYRRHAQTSGHVGPSCGLDKRWGLLGPIEINSGAGGCEWMNVTVHENWAELDARTDVHQGPVVPPPRRISYGLVQATVGVGTEKFGT